MKKIISLILALSLALSVLFTLTSCFGGDDSDGKDKEKEKETVPQDPEDAIEFLEYNRFMTSVLENGDSGFEENMSFYGIDPESVSLILSGFTVSGEYVTLFYCEDKKSAKIVAESFLDALVENSPLFGEEDKCGYSGKVAWIGYPDVLEAACKKLPCKVHTDDNGDNMCDRCNKTMSSYDDEPLPPNHDIVGDTEDSVTVTTEIGKIRERGYINVGITVYEPFDYIDGDGNWVGFDAELAEMFAERLGVECNFVIIDWGNKFAELEDKNIDLIWNALYPTEEYKTIADFSFSYAASFVVAVSNPYNGIEKDNIGSYRIAVASDIAYNVATQEIGTGSIYQFDTANEALIALRSGVADVALIDSGALARGIVLGTGDFYDLFYIDEAIWWEEYYAVGIRKNSELKTELDAFLYEKYRDGTMGMLSRKYGVFLSELTPNGN